MNFQQRVVLTLHQVLQEKNIHALDPVIITTQIASTNIKEYVDLEKVIEKTSFKQLGVGGIDTRGVARNLYPR